MRDATAEQIDTATLSRQIEQRFLNGGTVEVVSGPVSGAERARNKLVVDVVGQVLIVKKSTRGAGDAVRYEAELKLVRVDNARPLCRARHVIVKP